MEKIAGQPLASPQHSRRKTIVAAFQSTFLMAAASALVLVAFYLAEANWLASRRWDLAQTTTSNGQQLLQQSLFRADSAARMLVALEGNQALINEYLESLNGLVKAVVISEQSGHTRMLAGSPADNVIWHELIAGKPGGSSEVVWHAGLDAPVYSVAVPLDHRVLWLFWDLADLVAMLPSDAEHRLGGVWLMTAAGQYWSANGESIAEKPLADILRRWQRQDELATRDVSAGLSDKLETNPTVSVKLETAAGAMAYIDPLVSPTDLQTDSRAANTAWALV